MHYALFETAIGVCGVVWGDHGLKGVHLPDANPARTRASVARRFPGATLAEPPADVQRAREATDAQSLPKGLRPSGSPAEYR